MNATSDRQYAGKLTAANRALDMISDGARVGLGSGSTADIFIDLLAARVRGDGLRVSAVATSRRTEQRAAEAGLKLFDLSDLVSLDITVDGADEFTRDLNLIKGGGGALLREKIVADSSSLMIVIADSTKYVEQLGDFPLPIEVDKFGWKATSKKISKLLEKAGYRSRMIKRRMSGEKVFLTDGGNFVLDAHLARINEPKILSRRLNAIPGVVETGLFINQCKLLIEGFPDGKVREWHK